MLQLRILPKKLKNLFNDIAYLILDLVEHPVIIPPVTQYTCIFQIDKVPGGFGLRKIQDFFEIGNAHFAIHKNEVKNPQPRFISASFENLRSKGKIKTFQAHGTSLLYCQRYGKLGSCKAYPYI